MKNKIISLLLTAIMIVTLIPGTAFAKTYGGEFDSKTTDPNGKPYTCVWIFDEVSATLYVEGVGTLPEFTATTAPWAAHKDKVVSLVIEEGITTVGKRGFCNLSKLKNISFPSSLTKIDMRGFEYCTALETVTIPGNVKSVAAQVFLGCTSLKTAIFEEGVTAMNEYMFGNCKNLTDVYVYDKNAIISRARSNQDDGVWFRGCNYDILTAHCYKGTDADKYFSQDIYTITNWSNGLGNKVSGLTFAEKPNSLTANGYKLKVEYITD